MINREGGGPAARAKCANCGEEIMVELPTGWTVNLVGILQLIHIACGTTMNFGVDKIIPDKTTQDKQQDEKHREAIAGKLLEGVELNTE